MLTRRLACLALLLTACLPPPPSSADQRAIGAVTEAWGASGLPAVGDCLEGVTIVRHSTMATYVSECEGLMPGAGGREAALHSAACTDYETGWRRRLYIFHVAPEYAGVVEAVQHESLHALTDCLLDRPAADPWDGKHAEIPATRPPSSHTQNDRATPPPWYSASSAGRPATRSTSTPSPGGVGR